MHDEIIQLKTAGKRQISMEGDENSFDEDLINVGISLELQYFPITFEYLVPPSLI